jgi:murein DD-endopeptidase MepM/ murein hydrolase activator NlpD
MDNMNNYNENDLTSNLPLDEMAVMQEPAFDPEDTPPTGVYRRVDAPHKTNPRITQGIKTPGTGLRWLNWALSGAAMLVTLLAGAIYVQQSNPSPSPQPTQGVTIIEATTAETIVPTLSPTLPPAVGDASVPLDVVAELLMQPGDTAPPPDKIYRQQTAYTIAPVRARPGVIEYKIAVGDTLDKIAVHFGVSQDTVAWANDDIYVNRLLPGDLLTILPENGILHKTVSEQTLKAISEQYKVSPFVIIDSEYNRLQNASPDTLLPPGYPVFVPGGTTTKKPLYWNPKIETRDKSGKVSQGFVGNSGVGSNASGEVSFGGGPGSCGFQPNNGAGNLRVPMGIGYTVIRGYFDGHSGIDLAAPTGTTVFAAANGTVIFAGWSNWGYGNSIVLAHGSMFTLYGHLSRISVRCGQYVDAGTPIGSVGSTGNSSGPHLHFEIRPGGEPVNPTGYLPF